jgi:signal transduction histidine kinase
MGIKFSDPAAPDNLNRQGLAEYLKAQLKQLPGDSNQIKRIQLSRGGVAWPLANSVQNLTYARLSEIAARMKKDFGAIIVGSAKPLASKDEIAFTAIAQRLSELARVSELEADIQIRNQFLSIASHELKTPLTSIYGILQLQERMLRLKKDQTPFPDQDRHHNFLKMVIRQVERLNELIDGLLDVSRIQNGRFMVEPLDTDVAALLNDSTQSRLSVIAQEAGVKLSVDSVPNLIAWVDPVRMEEVIINLVMNAIRFSPEGGVVWIKLREENGAFRMTVRDQGPSIPIEDRERIFQPFERAQRTSRMGGLGLGLFISRQIAQLHGGNVSLVESVAGKGNIFEAYFPIRQPHLVTASA